MKQRIVRYAVLSAWALACATLGAVNFPTGTFLVAGGVKNSRHQLFGADEGLVVQAVSTNGAILAETEVTDPTLDGANAWNFRLRIPLTATATEQTAAVGDTVNLALKVGTDLRLAANPVTITRANAATNLFVQVVDVTAYTNDVGEVVYVADEYLDSIAPWLSYLGKDVYEPFADWDGDGSLNYQEYMNGTNPLDELDLLKISDYRIMSPQLHAISFEYVGGHAYGVLSTTQLAKPEWTTKKLKATAEGTDQSQVAYPGTELDVGTATIYVVPAVTTNNAEFFRLQGK